MAMAASPLSPEAERATFHFADPTLTAELVAAEPDVRAPVALAWDADGRMFVAEMTDYPSGPVNGRIRLLEDRDGDGRCESSIVFATNIAFPNSVLPWKNGILVTAAPDLWFLADTNGDGRADVREKVLTGFPEGNQQLRVNGLFWGIDNWIYGANGRSDGEPRWAASGAAVPAANSPAGVSPAPTGGTPVGPPAAGTAAPLPSMSIRRHDFRFRPDSKRFEAVAGHSQFGMGYDDWGNRFPVFNATPIRHVVIEDRYLARQPLLAGTDNVPSISPDDGTRVFALTPPTLLIPQPIGHFTSACGPSIYRGTALPASYRGNYFVCEPVQNLVQRRVLKQDGSTFIAEYDEHIRGGGRATLSPARRATHENSETVVGIQRRRAEDSVALPPAALNAPAKNPDPREFLASTDRWFHGVFTATGPDGALYIVDFYRDLVEHPQWVAPELRDKVDWRKGEEHGRIWRVRSQDAKQTRVPKLSRALNSGLVKALDSENGWTRDTAHRLLVERDARETIPALKRLVRRGSSQTQVHALNLLDAFGAATAEVLLGALEDSDPRVREHAVRLAEPTLATTGGGRSEQKVRAQFTTLAYDKDARVRLQVACSAGVLADKEQRLATLTALAQHDRLDEWQTLGILSSAGERPWLLMERLATRSRDLREPQVAFLERAARLIAAGKNDDDERALLAWLGKWPSVHRVSVAGAFAGALKSKDTLRALDSGALADLLVAAAAVARDSGTPMHVRLAAISLLGPAECAAFVEARQPEELQSAAARAVMTSGDIAAIRQVFERAPELTKGVRRQVIASAVRSRHAALELMRAASAEKLPLVEIDPTTRQALEKFSDAEVKAQAVELFKGAVSPDRETVVQKYRAALKMPADHKRGAAIFEKNCAVCHQMQGVGAKVGPDLSGTGQQPRETLLVQILDPSRQVLPDFVAYTAETKDGESYTGFIASESPTTVTLRRANEPDITLKRSDLKSFTTNGKSLMPDGLEAGMTEQDVADLIEFLRRPDRTLFSELR